MKKYKLLTNKGYPRRFKGGFYTENYKDHPSGLTTAELVEKYPEDWELVEDDFVLPEKWCIKATPETFDIIQEYFKKQLNRNPIDKEKRAFYHFLAPSFVCTSSIINSNYTEITFEQFKTYVLNMKEEKEIIGYKAPFDMYGGNIKQGDILKLKPNCTIAWYVNSSKNETFNIPEEIVTKWESVYKEEIPQITINGYKGEFFDWGVSFNNGCAKISKEAFIEFYRISKMFDKEDCLIHDNSNRNLTSVTIGKGTFSKEQIKEIAEYYLNKEK